MTRQDLVNKSIDKLNTVKEALELINILEYDECIAVLTGTKNLPSEIHSALMRRGKEANGGKTTLGFCWVKRNKNGSWFKGIGFYTKSNSEVCLIATKGKPPKKSVHHTVSQLVETVREEHSKKPDEVRKRIVEFTGDVPRIELFARQAAAGWDCWGNEVGKFEEVNE